MHLSLMFPFFSDSNSAQGGASSHALYMCQNYKVESIFRGYKSSGIMKNGKTPKWLEQLPLAPEFHPTDTEFADPIAYISKIEKEASAFGICKIIPPFPKPSKKYVLQNLNRSLSKCPELGSNANHVNVDSSGMRHSCDRTLSNGENMAVFTTRQQELGCEKGKKVKGVAGVGVQKQVWQSGEVYTLEQFEAKSKVFARSQLGMVKDANPFVIEAMFWKAASEKPIYVEYANDVPGSGFGEPSDSLRYFTRRRRKRRKRDSFDGNFVENSDSKNSVVDEVSVIKGDGDSRNQSVNLCTNTSSNSVFSFQCVDEMKGTAGWKLSNCPWNLQVIARSQGSLTRFMPDDIPGVTSPMVYIGMLFSWFAWHVEDHELHSLNFLHMGSPKTWYSVPGDYAVDFEEAIRVHAYGVNADRMDALSLLGEKTTILSPEIIVASGIPCCRLVQNPGEFVVTFPRAYHIGFSHGFNCGEAANFGTPQWLSIAKEAAVRRAAMNYLPMLSHQQLLYLLTMSFISRIPRTLLPGVRSSRLRDRQKEERELSVKRAFIQDILHENHLLTVLLQRQPWYVAVLWDAESMPSTPKEMKLYKQKDVPDNIVDISELGDYVGAVGFNLYDDGLPYDFQMESGTVPCIACGILGFPFMAVLQPSGIESIDLPFDSGTVVEGSDEDAAEKAKVNKKAFHRVNEESSMAETSRSAIVSKAEIVNGWNISDATLRPRIFCLEHAIETERLLSSKGGANILVICHSDFQKIKSHTAATAEEIGFPFRYTEIPLVKASREELNLIDIAIGQEEKGKHGDDWTSHLNINLQHCVRVKKNTPHKNIRHLLNLSGLFCDANVSGMKWVSRKLRSYRSLKKVELPPGNKPSDEMQIGEDGSMSKKDVQIIQYSVKRYKASACLKKVGSEGNFEDRSMARNISPGVEYNETLGVDDEIHDSCCGSEAHEVEAFGSNLDEIRVNEVERDEMNDIFPVGCDEEEASRRCRLSKPDENAPTHFQLDDRVEEKVIVERTETVNESSPSTSIEEHPGEAPRGSHDSKGKNVFSVVDDEEATAQAERSAKALVAIGCYEEEASRWCSLSKPDKNPPTNLHTETVNESPSASIEEHPGEAPVDKGSHGDKGKNVFSVVDDKESTAQSERSATKDHKYQLIKLNRGSHDDKGKNVFSVADDKEATAQARSKRRREVDMFPFDQFDFTGFIRSPCEGLRPRARPITSTSPTNGKKTRLPSNHSSPLKNAPKHQTGRYKCEFDGCTMRFETKTELTLHKGNRCSVRGCRKKFSAHKYAVQHKRVHDDERPLKCTWAGCTMSFKWAWARTEHLRLHTGERPYTCRVDGCGLTFRFVSDFSRHRRKTGHFGS